MSRPSDWSPLAGSDPAPGDAYAIAVLARRYADTAAAIDAAADALDRIHDSGTAWQSDAGRQFAVQTRETADSIRQAFRRYDETATALASYARALEEVQDDADRLLAEAKRAEAEADAAQRVADQAGPEAKDVRQREADDARGRLRAVVGRLGPVRDRWDEAGDAAAARIDDVIGDDGLADGFWDDVDGVVAVLTEKMGKLSAVLGVAALICTFVFPPGAAFFAALAFVTGAVSLAGNTYLYGRGRASLSDVVWDVVSVASFGAGRAFTASARGLVQAARGMAKPAFIDGLRAGGVSARQAQRVARASGFTSGGRVAKQAARAFRNGTLTWRPTGSQWRFAFTRPFRDVAPSGVRLSEEMTALPGLQLVLRQSHRAAAVAIGAGVAGNVADAHTLGPDVLPEQVPVFGADPTPVERGWSPSPR